MIKLGKGLAKLYQALTVADTETTRQFGRVYGRVRKNAAGQTGRHRRIKRAPESGPFSCPRRPYWQGPVILSNHSRRNEKDDGTQWDSGAYGDGGCGGNDG